ncbi:MAG: bifunctional nuclease family protein, partial [Fimbriimonas ginsengisoli]|nr:bifunctional nuclease family protein [Fimbriimonas ginsengisoli]
MPEEFDEPEGQPDDLDKPPSFFPYEDGPARRESHASGVLVEVQIEGVFAAESAGNVSRFVLLADPESGRKLPILIGPYEAQAITLPLEGRRPVRPMTH